MAKVTDKVIDFVCERMMEGESLTSICKQNPELPRRKTIMAYIIGDKPEAKAAHDKYTKARAIQGEYYFDMIEDIRTQKMPSMSDPRAFQAMANWKKIQMEMLEKRVRQLQPLGGVRNKSEDVSSGLPDMMMRWLEDKTGK
tara:strand:- start:232 stop:654 length:423 start_codon:yes stop_codon:yes gene_type:complete